MTAAEALAEKSREYELNARAAAEREDDEQAALWYAVTLALREVAEALEAAA